jgi:Raf kinase inhibitor-like YbhB/YbcL family protein
MRYVMLPFVVLAAVAVTGFKGIQSLSVTSTAFNNNGPIPVKFTCTGQGVNPPLTITGIPPEAKSLAIIVCDPDAVTKIMVPATAAKSSNRKGSHKKTAAKGTRTMNTCTVNGYTNWVAWNIDVTDRIPEDFRCEATGMNSAEHTGYQGMCPASGTHHYHFMVYALDTRLNIDKMTNKAGLEKVMAGHILAKGELTGDYNKTYR